MWMNPPIWIKKFVMFEDRYRYVEVMLQVMLQVTMCSVRVSTYLGENTEKSALLVYSVYTVCMCLS